MNTWDEIYAVAHEALVHTQVKNGTCSELQAMNMISGDNNTQKTIKNKQKQPRDGKVMKNRDESL